PFIQYSPQTPIYAETTPPSLTTLPFQNLKQLLLHPQTQNQLFQPIIHPKKALEPQPSQPITTNPQPPKIFQVQNV
ncbi:hypothetical protein, partial [Staphylococcus aureus]|uniref:hypothetical protein n=1 Tax=Staphylococcus aureus TaxID=1280 RepID=UPI001C92FFA3